MSARKQSKRARFAAFARWERARRRQLFSLDVLERGAAKLDAEWFFPKLTPAQVKRAGELQAIMDDAKMQMIEACGVRPRLIGFDLGEPGGDRSVVMWGRRNGKATIIEAIIEAIKEMEP